jgi:hypothetical protein
MYEITMLNDCFVIDIVLNYCFKDPPSKNSIHVPLTSNKMSHFVTKNKHGDTQSIFFFLYFEFCEDTIRWKI